MGYPRSAGRRHLRHASQDLRWAVEHTDDAHVGSFRANDAMLVGGADTIKNAGFELPALAGGPVLEGGVTRANVICLPVIFVPEVRVTGGV